MRRTNVLIFHSWEVQSIEDTAVAAIVVFLIAVISDALGEYKISLARKLRHQHELTRHKGGHTIKFARCYHLLLSTIYMMLTTFHYLLMLFAMTHSLVLLAAMIAGAGFGFFFTDHWNRNEARKKHLLSVDTSHAQESEVNSTSNEILSTPTSDDTITLPLISLQKFIDEPESDI